MTHSFDQDRVSFMAHAGPLNRQDTEGGPLNGCTLAVKDLYDVKGLQTGAGNPDWLETHTSANEDAWAVAQLMAAGTRLIGKTLTDEMAYSLIGANHHYGTPPNPKAPDRIPGGSSSGSASVVAQGLADIALGTDTGGSVRIPASFCGLYGFRPSHGRLPVSGLVPLGPSFDTVGWFARDAELLVRAGRVLMTQPDTAPPPKRFIRLEEMFAAVDPETLPLLYEAADRVAAVFDERASDMVEPSGFAEWRGTYIYVQGHEAWTAHGDWIKAETPKFGPLTQARFDFAKGISDADARTWSKTRSRLRTRVLDMIGKDAVLCLPTAPGAPIRRDAPEAEFDAFRGRVLDFTAYAGIAGAPQITIPVGMAGGGPIGLSLISAPGADIGLLELVRSLERAIQDGRNHPLPAHSC